MKHLWLLYFILHLGIGGMCGFTDIKMDIIPEVLVGKVSYTWHGKAKSMWLSPAMPYYIEEVQ